MGSLSMSKYAQERFIYVAMLMDNLKHDDNQLRLNSARSLITIAETIGPERARNELLPFLLGIFIFFCIVFYSLPYSYFKIALVMMMKF